MIEGLLDSPISVPAFLIMYILTLCILVIPRDVLPLFWSRLVFFPGVVLAAAYIFHTHRPTTIVIDYVSGNAVVAIFLYCSSYALMQDAQEQRLIGQPKLTKEYGLWWRIRWAIQLISDPRGIAFSGRAVNTPPPPTRTRAQFVVSRALRLARNALLADAAQLLIFSDPYVFMADPLVIEPVWKPFFRTILLGLHTIGLFDTVHTSISLLFVGSGIDAPQAWPDWFGPFAEMYTLRNFWGKVWHQSIQRMVVPHNKFVSRTVLRLPRGSYLSAFVQLLVAFSLSALMHCGGDYMAVRRLDISWPFFTSQAFGIAAEDWVIKLGGGMVSSAVVRRVIGYVWVLSWFRLSVPWIVGSWVDMGLVATPKSSRISVLNGLWSGDWVVHLG
ncbi:hypothetical protein BOTBODRAFT_35147 [Botryobasidium botryosum FD-172 SS1]|uniref:Wax synthase domain-containing protein n=1 Tax=Botryobasidium botryosum (strain FD-172 SS1) TaxID=930990 RepID=A0A067M814_BOTB1|nr:hypothetical protein BOTBODRAFT_35147 [Botryobasidium botryosum FD-172 SS1]